MFQRPFVRGPLGSDGAPLTTTEAREVHLTGREQFLLDFRLNPKTFGAIYEGNPVHPTSEEGNKIFDTSRYHRSPNLAYF